jgi:hypothetical protein
MDENQPYFHVALNLPHAGRVAHRIVLLTSRAGAGYGVASEAIQRTARAMEELLAPCVELDENPAGDLAGSIRDRAAELGRKLVEQIERDKAGHDRLGQCVRNFFETLELGREGAAISLRAGENPRSMQRPN